MYMKSCLEIVKRTLEGVLFIYIKTAILDLYQLLRRQENN